MEKPKENQPKKKREVEKIRVHNRKASYEYQLLDEFDCGIILFGSEVKSIRAGQTSISEAYCYVNKGCVYIKNMHIPVLKNTAVPHEPLRDRQLLLTKKEIEKLNSSLKNQGLTLIPTLLYNKKGLMKLKIQLAKGKKLYDKRESIKKRDVERDLKREGL